MKNLILLMTFLTGFIFVYYSSADAKTDLKAYEIMKQVDERYDGDDRESEMIMVLIDKKGKKRTRNLLVYSRDDKEDTWSASFFLSPGDVRDTGFLSYDYDKTTDDDQWLYLPALHKVKRIASNDKTSSFMGSDFSYADMTDKEVDDYNYKLLKVTNLNGKKCYIIESIPKTRKILEDFGYKKSVLFVDADSFIVVRGIHWLRENNRVKFYEIKKMVKIQGIMTPIEIHMVTKKGGAFSHKTILVHKNIKYNQKLNENLFTVRQLEKGGK